MSNELLFKELSYEITGLLFDIYNSIGFGHDEKTYANYFEEVLKNKKINYNREQYWPIKVGEKLIKKQFFDYLIEDKIVLELKSGNKDYRESCGQLYHYLKSSGYKLGIVARFTRFGVKIKRIPNFN